jgi:hypothetical protein
MGTGVNSRCPWARGRGCKALKKAEMLILESARSITVRRRTEMEGAPEKVSDPGSNLDFAIANIEQ